MEGQRVKPSPRPVPQKCQRCGHDPAANAIVDKDERGGGRRGSGKAMLGNDGALFQLDDRVLVNTSTTRGPVHATVCFKGRVHFTGGPRELVLGLSLDKPIGSNNGTKEYSAQSGQDVVLVLVQAWSTPSTLSSTFSCQCLDLDTIFNFDFCCTAPDPMQWCWLEPLSSNASDSTSSLM